MPDPEDVEDTLTAIRLNKDLNYDNALIYLETGRGVTRARSDPIRRACLPVQPAWRSRPMADCTAPCPTLRCPGRQGECVDYPFGGPSVQAPMNGIGRGPSSLAAE